MLWLQFKLDLTIEHHFIKLPRLWERFSLVKRMVFSSLKRPEGWLAQQNIAKKTFGTVYLQCAKLSVRVLVQSTVGIS